MGKPSHGHWLATGPVQNTRGKGRKRESPRAQLTHAIPLIRLEFSEDQERGPLLLTVHLLSRFYPWAPYLKLFTLLYFLNAHVFVLIFIRPST